MKDVFRRRLQGRLGILGLSQGRAAEVMGVHGTTLSRFLSPNYTDLPAWLKQHLNHLLFGGKQDLFSPDFQAEWCSCDHPHFRLLEPAPDLSESQKWFADTYEGTPKPKPSQSRA